MSPIKNKLLKDFKVNFVKDMGGNYLVINIPPQQKRVLHQLEIINRNLPVGIIPIETREINNQTMLYYRLNSYLSLSYYLEREAISGEELITILDEIVHILMQSKNYLLSASSFLLHPDYIYLNAGRQEVFLLYLPVKLPGSVNENFRKLFKKAASFCADSPQSLVTYSEEQLFNLQGFREEVMKMKLSVFKKGKKTKEKAKPFCLEPEVSLSGSYQMKQKQNFFLKRLTLKQKVMVGFGLFQIIISVVLLYFLPGLTL